VNPQNKKIKLNNMLERSGISCNNAYMNKLPLEKRSRILSALVEGNSMRSTSRMVDVSINTVTKLLIDAGIACSEYQDATLRNLPCKRIEIDEIWAFCYAKQKNVEGAKAAPERAGDIWTWTSLCAETKLVPSWMIGNRDGDTAKTFIADLASRLLNRVQLTSDGHKAYLEAVEGAFGADIDYAMLVKIYGEAPEGQRRYSPAEFSGSKKLPSQDLPILTTFPRPSLSARISPCDGSLD